MKKFVTVMTLAGVAMFAMDAQGVLVGSYSENFNSDFGNTLTQDAGQALINQHRVSATEEQTAFGPSPGVAQSNGLFPWTEVAPATVLADGALQLGTRTGGGMVNKGSTNPTTGEFGIGTYKYEFEWEAFYNGIPNPPALVRPAAGLANVGEKRAVAVLMSDSFTGDTNAPTRGVAIIMGQTGFGGGLGIQGHTAGPEIPLWAYGADHVGPESRPWQMGSLPDVDRLKVEVEVTIDAAGKLNLFYGSPGGVLTHEVVDLDVSPFLADNAGCGQVCGYWNIATQDAGTARWDSLSYQIPEPASVALLGLGGLMIARRRRA